MLHCLANPTDNYRVPRPSPLRLVLQRFDMDSLREIADHFEVLRARSSSETITRIIRHLKGDLGNLVCDNGLLPRDAWNNFVEKELHGERRKSFEDIREEIVFCLLLGEYRDYSVTDLREDPDLLAEVSQALGVDVARLRRRLANYHGRTLLGNIAHELIPSSDGDRRRGPREQPTTSESNVSGEVGTPSRVSAPSKMNPMHSSIASEPTIGYLLRGRWRVRRRLGQGGFGTAYEVSDMEHPSLPPVVAKFPIPERLDDLRREFEKCQGVHHRNICAYKTSDKDERYGFFAIIEHGGRSLADVYGSTHAAIRDAVDYIGQAAIGLDFLHDSNLVHGDVNPGNILVDGSRIVRITDFGLSSRLQTVAATDRMTRVGTELWGYHRLYSAPEVQAGGRPHRGSDQYSLALVFCAMLVGVDAFSGINDCYHELSEQHRRAIDRALSPAVANRFSRCADFARELRQ